MQNINKLKLKGCAHKHNWFLRTIQNNCQFIQIIYSYADMETKGTKEILSFIEMKQNRK